MPSAPSERCLREAKEIKDEREALTWILVKHGGTPLMISCVMHPAPPRGHCSWRYVPIQGMPPICFFCVRNNEGSKHLNLIQH
jgi:hypothetical protein